MGWTDIDEYVTVNGVPEVWPDSGLYSMVMSKESGFFVYWYVLLRRPQASVG